VAAAIAFIARACKLPGLWLKGPSRSVRLDLGEPAKHEASDDFIPAQSALIVADQ
jgi:hypothetical protein